MAKTRRTRFTVRLSRAGRFPMDMLRYDEAFPASSQDAVLISALNGQDDETVRNLPRQVEVTLYTDQVGAPTLGRWKSFLVDVISVSSATRA